MSVPVAVADYIAAIEPPEIRALFERLHELVIDVRPDAEVDLAYDMPAYRVGRRRLNLGAWKHGVSIYGWRSDRDGGFVARHPTLSSGKSTLRVSPSVAASISDEEFTALFGGALEP